MSTTNHTSNYELSQYIGSDVTSYLSNYNADMYKIDAQMKENADDAAEAKSDATAAVSAATSAASSASAAVSTANAANTTAEAAQTAATAAQTAAGAAQTDAAAALRASASNSIGNLAPAYDATLTYDVDDLVTYIDPETNQGKLYKCIIAIAVPEEFNINKWDDVTTSEIYANKSELISTVASDGVKTYKEILNTLCPASFDVNSEYLLTWSENNETEVAHMKNIKSTNAGFSIAYDNVSSFQSLRYLIHATDSGVRISSITSGGFTSTEAGDTVVNAGRTFKLYKLLTI